MTPIAGGSAQDIAQRPPEGHKRAPNCPRCGDTACVPGTLSTRSGTALYVGAVLGPGVLLIPSLAADAAGPASILAWAALLALSAPLAITFAALGVRQPEAGGTAAYARAAFGARAGAITGWWFLAGVLIGAPAVALIGSLYVADLLGAGREAAVAGAAAMVAGVAGRERRRTADDRPAPARAGSRARRPAVRRDRHGASREPHGQLAAVRATWLGRGRHRGEPADVLVHRLGGRLAPGRRARRSRAPVAARDLRRPGDRGRPLPRAGGRHRRRARSRRRRTCRSPT